MFTCFTLQYTLQSVHLNQMLSKSVAVSCLASWYSDPDVMEVTSSLFASLLLAF